MHDDERVERRNVARDERSERSERSERERKRKRGKRKISERENCCLREDGENKNRCSIVENEGGGGNMAVSYTRSRRTREREREYRNGLVPGPPV